MALHLLNPGLRPLGLFDLEDDTELEGGEYVSLVANSDVSAADAAGVGPFDDTDGSNQMQMQLAASAAGSWGGLADDGQEGYGTLFGSLIGANAGQATTVTGGGAVVLGPQTSLASGKVTVWTQQGLYGVSDAEADANALSAGTGAANATIAAETTTGCLTTDTSVNAPLGYLVGHMADRSLVSTTNLAAGETLEIECSVIYYTGVDNA